jgi:signal transduction histidine kinase
LILAGMPIAPAVRTVELPSPVDTVARLVVASHAEAWPAELCRLLTEIFGLDGCLIFRVEPSTEQLRLAGAYPTQPNAGELRIPYGSEIIGRVGASGVPAVLARDAPRGELSRRMGLGADGQVSRMCVPALTPEGATVGVIALHTHRSRTFAQHEVTRAGELADLVALRLHGDQLDAELAESRVQWRAVGSAMVAAQESERRRIARDLHDGVAQAITSLNYYLSAAEEAILAGSPTDGLDKIAQARRITDLAVREVRRTAVSLRSPVLDDLGLAAALESLARSVPQLPVRVDATEAAIPEHVATALFRMAQEAVHNVVKHAGAAHALIRLVVRADTAILTVSDDGQGFHHGRPEPNNRYGLVGIRERAALLGGEVTVHSTIGDGTTVRMAVPLGSSR